MKGIQEISRGRKFLNLFGMYLFTLGVIGVWLFLNEILFPKIAGIFFIITILFGMISFHIISRGIEWKKFFRIGITYGISLGVVIGALWLPDPAKPIWVASVILAFLTNPALGICFYILFLLITTFLLGLSLEMFIFYLIMGLGGALLAPYMKSKKLTSMCMVILAGVCVTNYSGMILIGGKGFTPYGLKEVSFGFLLGILIFLFYMLFVGKGENLYLANKKLEKRLTQITDYDYELLGDMKVKSDKLYEHGQKVGRLSESMAFIAGANPILAKAGGYYYKSGKLLGKDHTLYGAQIGKKYNLPIEVISIISEHPGKGSNPSTIESGIVLLADAVVSGFEYIYAKNLQIEFDKEKAVEQIVKNKIEKGYLDSSGISIKLYESLKSYLMKEGKNL